MLWETIWLTLTGCCSGSKSTLHVPDIVRRPRILRRWRAFFRHTGQVDVLSILCLSLDLTNGHRRSNYKKEQWHNISNKVKSRTPNNSKMNQATQHCDWNKPCSCLQTLSAFTSDAYFKQLFRNCESTLITTGNCTWQADCLNKSFWKCLHLWLLYIAVFALHHSYLLQFLNLES